jgi:hypothetical protein
MEELAVVVVEEGQEEEGPSRGEVVVVDRKTWRKRFRLLDITRNDDPDCFQAEASSATNTCVVRDGRLSPTAFLSEVANGYCSSLGRRRLRSIKIAPSFTTGLVHS